MKVLLVNPYIHDVTAYDYWLKPVGLLYISSALKRAGAEVELLDLLDRAIPGANAHTGRYGTGKFRSVVIKTLKEYGIPRYLKRYGAPESAFDAVRFEPDVILVTSMMTYWYNGVFETVRLLKERFGAPVILGGNYATLLPSHAKGSGADLVIAGEGIPGVYDAIETVTGTALDRAVGKDWFEEITPDYTFYKSLDSAVVHTTYGCPYRCTYCVAWKKGFRSRSVESVLGEIEALERMGAEDVAFYDDAILVDRDRFKRIVGGLPDGPRYHLPNGIHAALLDEELSFMLKEKNFKTIRIGYETGDAVLQRKTGGKVNDTAFERAASLLGKAGFSSSEVGAYLIVGIPGQSFESALEDMKKVAAAGIRPVINEYTLIPGSNDWDSAIERGTVTEETDPFLLKSSLISYWWKDSMGIKKIKALKSVAHDFYSGKLSVEDLLNTNP